MIKIVQGPSLERYALWVIGGEDQDTAVAEVVTWASGYVNGPWSESLLPHLEATEQERWTSIKAYIASEIENSVTGRIQKSILSSRPTAGSRALEAIA